MCVQKVNASIDRIRACYEEEAMKSYSDDEIARMMVMDACFILEFSYKSCREDVFEENNMLIEPSMVFDLLLIENQIPFFVLQDMFDCTCSRFKPAAASLNHLIILGLAQQVHIFESDLTNKNDTTTHDHILGLIHECYRPSHPARSLMSSSAVFHSAIELDRAGVKFKPHDRDPEWCMAIELEFVCSSWHWPSGGWGKPTLRMPVVCIHDYTELVLRNLIAYEQLCPLVRNYVTSYAAAMDMLIDNEEDVAILVQSKVLINIIGSNEEAAKMINDIRKEVSTTDFFYSREWQELDMYYNGYWPKNIAWLRRTYFSSPWNMIALFAGILLFILTMLQTYFTINPVQSQSSMHTYVRWLHWSVGELQYGKPGRWKLTAGKVMSWDFLCFLCSINHISQQNNTIWNGKWC
ncbi:hypothetical protein L6452_40080 [Arctium lappa]|uniref:Uncharacterized protein n=1 Tax=Arctium lappa TaxID=4217 RepID=A0ACB8XKV3_ARCLA|nr:hypothetical protein L6452_40080 [Arctium lappa]